MEFVIFIIFLALVFDFYNGMNDAANSIATIVATRVLTPFQAVAWAAFFNFSAAFLFGVSVATTIGKGIVDVSIVDNFVILSGLVGAIILTASATHLGLPISVSHSIIGGFGGAAIAKAGFRALIVSGITQTLEGLLEIVHQHDMRLMIDIIGPEHEREIYLELARAKRIDGILLSGPRLDDEALGLLEKEGFPTVLIGQLAGSGFCFVDVDNCASAEMAVAHLIQLGHTRIACITNAPLTYTAAIDRLHGYKQALDEAGIPYDESLVRYGEFDCESGFRQLQLRNRRLSGPRDLSDRRLCGLRIDRLAPGAAEADKMSRVVEGLTIPFGGPNVCLIANIGSTPYPAIAVWAKRGQTRLEYVVWFGGSEAP